MTARNRPARFPAEAAAARATARRLFEFCDELELRREPEPRLRVQAERLERAALRYDLGAPGAARELKLTIDSAEAWIALAEHAREISGR